MVLGYCTECFTEHVLQGAPSGKGLCMNCNKKEVLYSNDQPYVAFCNTCFQIHKTHQKVVTFKKCTKCGQFDGLKFSKDPPVAASCEKCKMTSWTNMPKATFHKCPYCGQFNGLKFKK